MRRVALVLLVALAWAAAPHPAAAYSCPLLIKEADDLIARAETAVHKSTAADRASAERALAEARKDHEGARAKADHAAAVRKAKIAKAYAEEAQILAER